MKGMIFYLDAIMALVLALVIVGGVGVYYSIEPELEYKTIHTEAEDIMQLMSQEINNTELGLDENYTDKSYLEAIGTLWLNGNRTKAREVAASMLDKFDRRCLELSFEGEVIYNVTDCEEEDRSVAVANRVASGYTQGKKPDGFTSRVILNRERRVISDYVYFGGYEGDGNLTKKMHLRFLDQVLSAQMELDAGSEFILYVNGAESGEYIPSESNMSGDTFHICNESSPAYCGNFQENNTLDFFFTGNGSYIGGGYLKVLYNTTELEEDILEDRYEFPGIKGVINLYSSFYIPGTLQEMNAFLHYTSNYTIFMNLGNGTVYTGSSPEDVDINVTINNSEMTSTLASGGMSYADLSNKTIPLRLGMQNVSYVTIGYEAADVFSVTDLSGSMRCAEQGYQSGCGYCYQTQWRCECCGGTWLEPIDNAKNANHDLIDIILNYTTNRVGLAGYETQARDSDFHPLSNDSSSLGDMMDNVWDADGGTCTCCGINKAVEGLIPGLMFEGGQLAAYYRLDGDVQDSSGNGNDGTEYGNPQYVGGVNGSALDFDGDDYVRVPDDDSIGNSGMSGLTFSMWIYPRDDSSYMHVAGTTDDWDGDGYNFYLRGGKTDYEYSFMIDGSTARGGNIDTDRWIHLAGTYNGTFMVLYLNGTQVGETSTSGNINPNDEDLYIGRVRGYGSASYFDGLIDDVRVYDYALDQEEIEDLANTVPLCGNNLVETGEVCDGSSGVCPVSGGNGKKDCNSQCDGFDSCSQECGDGVIGGGEECDDGNTNSSDGCSGFCTREKEWYRSMIVMSDGHANERCAEQGTGDPAQDAVQAACDAYNNHGIEVYAVGFGEGADEETLKNIADCGHGEYYYADVTELEEIYRLIAAQILNASYKAQTVEVYEGGYGNIILYPDSYINFIFDSSVEETDYGEIPVRISSPKFSGLVESPKNGSFIVPNGTRILDAKITSYSSEYWTDRAMIDNGTDYEYVYRLWDYGLEYKNLGDPYVVYLPVEKISQGLNNVSIDTGGREENTTGGSPDSRVIYTLAVNILSDYGGVFNKSQGCEKEIYYDLDLDGTQDGSIYVNVGNASDPYDPDIDAIDNAFMKLLDKLNFYEDTGTDDGENGNPIDVYPGELSFDTIPLGGIPWLWGPGLFTLKVW